MLVLHYIAAAVARGERAALFVFDEELGLLFTRAKADGHRPRRRCATPDKLFIEQMDAAELSPGEFSIACAPASTGKTSSTVAIDSLNGYQAAMPEEQFLILHLHELLQYLNRQGAATFLTVAQHGMIGDMKQTIDVTYLADTVIMLRYFEALGRVRRAMSVIKKRTGPHEDTIREFRIDNKRHHARPAARGIPGRVARRSDLSSGSRGPLIGRARLTSSGRSSCASGR